MFITNTSLLCIQILLIMNFMEKSIQKKRNDYYNQWALQFISYPLESSNRLMVLVFCIKNVHWCLQLFIYLPDEIDIQLCKLLLMLKLHIVLHHLDVVCVFFKKHIIYPDRFPETYMYRIKWSDIHCFPVVNMFQDLILLIMVFS